ncbi:hypothetical protein R6Q57_011451 [Mikania cordata]
MELDDERIQKLKPNGEGKQPVENPKPLEVSTIKKSQEQKESAFKKKKVIAIRDWPPGCGPATTLWNPVTGSYKLLSTHDLHGFFEHNANAVGLYIDASDDYKVLHIKRRFGLFDVNVYSRIFESWRNIAFLTRSEYLSPSFSLSSGTFYGDTLYFTVCDCWIGGENVLFCFDVNSEIFMEITFPPLASA